MPDTDDRDRWVERVLGVAVAGFGATPRSGDEAEARGNAVRLAQALLLWNGARSHVGQQVETLQNAILAEMRDEPDFADIAAGIGNLNDILETLDDSLSDKLGELRGSTDPREKQALSAQARDIVRGFQRFAEQDGLMNEIDDNGFVALDIKARVTGALASILETI